MLTLEQNYSLRGRVRSGFDGRRMPVVVPGDMSIEEVTEKFGRELAMNLVSYLPDGAGGVGFRGDGVTGGAVSPMARPEDDVRLYYPPPPSVSFPMAPAVSTRENWLSRGCAGPTILNHISIVVLPRSPGEAGASNDKVMVGVHVIRGGNPGPFAGDLGIFDMNTPGDPFGISQGPGVMIPGGRQTGPPVGLVPAAMDFFPRVRIPYRSFNINLSTLAVDGQVDVFVTVDFEGVEMSEREIMRFVDIQPRYAYGIPTASRMSYGTAGGMGNIGNNAEAGIIPIRMPITKPVKPAAGEPVIPAAPVVVVSPVVVPVAPVRVAPAPVVPATGQFVVPAAPMEPAPPKVAAIAKPPAPQRITYTGLFRDANDLREKQAEGVKVTLSTARSTTNTHPGYNFRATVYAFPGQVPMAWMGGIENSPWGSR